MTEDNRACSEVSNQFCLSLKNGFLDSEQILHETSSEDNDKLLFLLKD